MHTCKHFAMEKDVIEACIDDMSDEELEAMLETAHESIDHACQQAGMDPAVIRQMAAHMDLDPNNWAILTKPDFRKYIIDNDSPIVDGHGWSLFRGWGPETKDSLKIFEACFIEKGHLIFRTLEAGQRVEFGIEQGQKGPQATQVTVL